MRETQPQDVIMVGAGGLGQEVAGYLLDDPRYNLIAVLDDSATGTLGGIPIEPLVGYKGSCRKAVLSVGMPQSRVGLAEKCQELEWVTFIHQSAQVSRLAELGVGVFVGPFATVAGNARVGDLAFINAYASVGHDASVGRACSMMPYGYVGGGAQLGEACFVATSGKVLPGVEVGPQSRISAGAILHRNMPGDHIAFGNPARFQPDIAMLRARKAAKSKK